MNDLFDEQDSSEPLTGSTQNSDQPLAARMRPKELSAYAGQKHLFEAGKPLYQAIINGKPHSMLLWGPPGTGKTTLAKIIANSSDCYFIAISAVLGSIKDIRQAVDQAKLQKQRGKQTLLFVDEVHRFNKSQQDAFLPYVEDGTFIFIGATTENPSFEVNNALLSRAKTYVLKSLTNQDLCEVLTRAVETEGERLGLSIELTDEAKDLLVAFADGDARRLLNVAEMAFEQVSIAGQHAIEINKKSVEPLLGENARRFDNKGEAFYDQISALHKSVRGSDPDASLYWFCRMLDGGCDPLYIARRVVRMASEEVGNADPRAIQVATSAWDVQQRLGSPEGELAIAQAIIYLAVAAKSNAVYKAFNNCMSQVKSEPSYEVPMHIRNAPTELMKSLDYGTEYRYDHDEPDAYAAGQTYFPKEVSQTGYYYPVERGVEKQIKEKLKYLKDKDRIAVLDKGSKN
ncbi:MAG: replication-associated recombination protein A [Kangiellaceae bacterium]|nr:replication-associated recombination protein A [Kangiellaceae bacterium]